MLGACTLKRTPKGSRYLTALLADNFSSLLRYLQRRVGLNDAPDLLSETMLTAWRRIEDLPSDPQNARMWLFGVARGTLLNHARGEHRRSALTERIRQQTTLSSPVSPAADAGAEVRDAVSRLNPEQAELIRLVHWDQFTLAEAAAILSIPASTARGRYRTAKQSLRTMLDISPILA